jgi:hypothetical protein
MTHRLRVLVFLGLAILLSRVGRSVWGVFRNASDWMARISGEVV